MNKPMYKNNSPIQRKAVKQARITAILRQSILSGRYAPGAQIPIQTALMRQFQVSGFTVQMVLNRLVEEGFLETRGRNGTFVVEHPPHLYRYALTLPQDPADVEAPLWSRLYTALVNAAHGLQQTERRQIDVFYGITEHTDTDEYRRLLDRLKTHQYAGIIFGQSPHRLVETPLMARDGVPRVAIMSRCAYPHVPAVVHDLDSFARKSLDYLAAANRRRAALVYFHHSDDEKSVLALAAKRGWTMRPEWILPMGLPPVGAKNWVQLLMSGRLKDRPNGLIIADDNFVEPVVAGLIAARVRVPEELTVVAHCNFPWAGVRVLPLKWIGFDSRRVLGACLDVIDQQRRGRTPPRETRVEASGEEESPGQMPRAEYRTAKLKGSSVQ